VARRKDRLQILAQELQREYGIQVEILVADLGLVTDLNRVANATAGDERVTVLVGTTQAQHRLSPPSRLVSRIGMAIVVA
jgi:short-subunit dehydrogenase